MGPLGVNFLKFMLSARTALAGRGYGTGTRGSGGLRKWTVRVHARQPVVQPGPWNQMAKACLPAHEESWGAWESHRPRSLYQRQTCRGMDAPLSFLTTRTAGRCGHTAIRVLPWTKPRFLSALSVILNPCWAVIISLAHSFTPLLVFPGNSNNSLSQETLRLSSGDPNLWYLPKIHFWGKGRNTHKLKSPI